jgi:hypothetical protein
MGDVGRFRGMFALLRNAGTSAKFRRRQCGGFGTLTGMHAVENIKKYVTLLLYDIAAMIQFGFSRRGRSDMTAPSGDQTGIGLDE